MAAGFRGAFRGQRRYGARAQRAQRKWGLLGRGVLGGSPEA